MATELEAAGYGGDSWSQPALYRDGESSQAFCISNLADHRSISFGRYESEGLAWEKFSVFSPNRRKEDLAKSTAPGLVAQKKAYFEEYFKGFRVMKGLFKRESGEESRSRSGNESGVEIDHDDATTTEWGGCDSSYAVPIQVLEKEDIADLVSRHNVMMGVECREGKGDSLVDHASYIGNLDTVMKDGFKCSKEVNRAKQVKKPVSAKGSVASVASKPKVGSRMKGDLGKNSERLKPAVTRSVTKKPVKEGNPAQASKNIKSNNVLPVRKLGEVQKSTVSGVHVKSAREKVVLPTKTENLKPISRKLPVSAQNTKGITATGHPKRPSLTNRNCNEVGNKSSSSSGCQSRGEPENLRPKPMSTNLAANSTSKVGARSTRIDSGRGVKQEKGTAATNARIGRDPKPSPSKLTDIHKTSKANSERKISSSRVSLTSEAKDQRQRIPTWR